MNLLTVALLASSMLASPGALERYTVHGKVVNAVTLDAASTNFAINWTQADQRGVYGLMSVWVELTDADNSVTAFNMTCYGSRDENTTDYTLQSCDVATGVCTSSDASWTKNPSALATKSWVWRVDVESMPAVNCTITDTGGDASDSMTVYATFSTKG